MALICILSDSRLPFADQTDACHTAMTTPMGVRTVGWHLLQRIGRLSGARVMVFPDFVPPTDAYRERLHLACDCTLQIVPPAEQAAALQRAEPGDAILGIESRYWVDEGCDFAGLIRLHTDDLGGVHLVTGLTGDEVPREHVMLDAAGRVRRVQRLYARTAWAENRNVVVPVSLVRQVAVDQGDLFPLHALRARLASGGITNRDVRLDAGVTDLHRVDGFVPACRAAVTRSLADDDLPEEFTVRGNTIAIGPGAGLAPTARLVGPLIVQRGATIGERATVIGPTVIGAGVMVGDDAVVAQSVVLDGAEVTADSIVRGGVVSGNGMLHVTQATPTAGAAAGRMSINQVTLSGKRTPRRIGRPIFPAIKRGLDFIVALLLLLFLAPLWPLIFLAIKLDSAGPVFFLHSREGLDGREFGCIKFRTMRADADQIQRELADANVVDGPQFKIDDDPRITRVGKWLRLSNIDELPQLINVLRGEMSLVGPRPSPFRENQICAPWRRARLSVRPGITGLWQICRADRDEGDFHQWIYYDVLYVRHFSFRLDVKILLATLTSLGGHRRIPITRIVNLRRYDHATGDFPAALPT